ncbi:hypothetical protein HNQ71_006862 [Mesorhizobium sangaii]|uniref:Transposase n=1 Tax=Mesorhizobium sangaii TaxID=505389 RepID=A0A841PKK1_9HYPH|nr:hypothetical protein [Mesorhizobium sangaii]
MPILAKGKTATGHIWTYIRDDRPFGGTSPPAALYYASRDRRQDHPERRLQDFTGILQADAYSGYNTLYDPSRAQGPITPALCWAHARRQFFELADIAANARRGKKAPSISPVALEAVKRIDALFDIERGINGLHAQQRLAARKERSAPLLTKLEEWLRDECSRLSRSASVAKPIDYMLRRWGGFARFIEDGRICLTNNAAERALRGFALGRKSWLFAGSERGAARAAAMATLIMTAKLNDVEPQAWLADVLARIADTPQNRLQELLPWNWQPRQILMASAASTARGTVPPTAEDLRPSQGLRLVHRVCNQPLPMQTIRHIPIEALPGASLIVQRQPKQRQDRIIDLVRVDLHPPNLAQIARLPRPRPDGYQVPIDSSRAEKPVVVLDPTLVYDREQTAEGINADDPFVTHRPATQLQPLSCWPGHP